MLKEDEEMIKRIQEQNREMQIKINQMENTVAYCHTYHDMWVKYFKEKGEPMPQEMIDFIEYL